MRYAQRAGCEDGPCPKMSDDLDTGDVIVQGAFVNDPSYRDEVGPVPSHEGVVSIPRAVLEQYLIATGRVGKPTA